jgi:hypothetical protein
MEQIARKDFDRQFLMRTLILTIFAICCDDLASLKESAAAITFSVKTASKKL